MPREWCFRKQVQSRRSSLGGGLPGFQPKLLGGGGGVAGGSGMVGSSARARSRLLSRQAMNTSCNLSASPYAGPRTSPFRVVNNAGDVRGTVDKSPLEAANQLYGLNGKRQHLRRDSVHTGPAAYSGNPTYVYDSSNYTRFKGLVAKQKTYNDLSFGGDGRGVWPLGAWRSGVTA